MTKGTYHRDFDYEILVLDANRDDINNNIEAEINVVEILIEKHYVCRALSRPNSQVLFDPSVPRAEF